MILGLILILLAKIYDILVNFLNLSPSYIRLKMDIYTQLTQVIHRKLRLFNLLCESFLLWFVSLIACSTPFIQ